LPTQIKESALYKLDVLNAAKELKDLRSPPGNKLEALKGNLSGFYSIVLILSGVSFFVGLMEMFKMCKLLIITNTGEIFL
jgi:hypothetical protein